MCWRTAYSPPDNRIYTYIIYILCVQSAAIDHMEDKVTALTCRQSSDLRIEPSPFGQDRSLCLSFSLSHFIALFFPLPPPHPHYLPLVENRVKLFAVSPTVTQRALLTSVLWRSKYFYNFLIDSLICKCSHD